MITLGLAWIDSKYKMGYDLLYVGTVILDFNLLSCLFQQLTK